MSLSDRLARSPGTTFSDGGQHQAETRTAGIAPVSAIPVSAPVMTGAPSGFSRRSTRRAYDPLAPVRRRAHQVLLDLLGPQLYELTSNEDELARRVREVLPGVLNQDESLTASDRAQAYQQILDEILGHGPIEPLLRDPAVTEIMV